MAISTNYATPVWVNGYQCKNCTQVDEAKKFIDPAHPQSGPFGIDAKTDPSVVDNPVVQAKAAAQAGGSTTSGGSTPQSSSSSGLGGLFDFTV